MRFISGIPAKENILNEKIGQIRDRYDYIIIDCPPNLGFLTMNAFAAATDMLVVIKPEYFALEGLKRISKIAGLVQKRLNPDLGTRKSEINYTGTRPETYDGNGTDGGDSTDPEVGQT